jgi:hypothetical protein
VETGRLEGEWWLPETAQKRVAGVLTLAWGYRPHLELRGLLGGTDLAEEVRLVLVRGEGYRVIHGETADGRSVTLEGASSEGGSDINLEDPSRSIIQLELRRAWIGALMSQPSDEIFGSVRLQLQHLVDLSPHSSVAKVAGGIINIDVIAPEQTSRQFEHRDDLAEFRIELEEPVRITEWVAGYLRPLTNLVALATGRDIEIIRLVLERSGSSGHGPVEIVDRRRHRAEHAERRLFPPEILFDFGTLPASFGSAIPLWLAVSARLGAILDLFLGPVFAPFMYEEHRFLNFAQAAESYHRIQIGGTKLPQEEYDRLVATAVNACPAEIKDWLADALVFGNGLSSAFRLRALLDHRPWMEGEVIERFPRFVRRVVDTRNYHTHWDEPMRVKSASGIDLWPLNEQLAVLLEACLLEELGFSVDAAAQAIRTASAHYSAIRMNPGLFAGTT